MNHDITQDDLKGTALSNVDINAQLSAQQRVANIATQMLAFAEAIDEMVHDYSLMNIAHVRAQLTIAHAQLNLLEQLVESGNIVTKESVINQAVRKIYARERPALKIVS